MFTALRKEVKESNLKASGISRAGNTEGEQGCKENLLAYQNTTGQADVLLVSWDGFPMHLLQIVALAGKGRWMHFHNCIGYLLGSGMLG